MRRLVAIAGFFLLVSLPMLVQLVGGDPGGGVENRVLSPPPRLPTSLAGVATLPRATSAWLDDHFGLRRPLVELSNAWHFALFGESGNPQIAFGRHGTLFLTSHDAADPQQMLLFLCRGGDVDAASRAMADALAGFLDAGLRHDPRMIDLLVPTKTIIDRTDLPGWMRARCGGGREVLPALLSSLAARRPDLRARVLYPLSLMQGLQGADAPYPKFNFHWDGPGLRRVAAAVALRFGRPERAPLGLRAQDKSSDIAHLLPGVRLPFRTFEPDLAAAGIEASTRIDELGISGAILGDVSRFTRHDRAGPKLLILSDSFGQAIAPWFSAYYGEVWHVAVNNIAALSPARRAELLDRLFHRFRPDDLLFVFHDFSQGFINQQLMQALWREPAGPPSR